MPTQFYDVPEACLAIFSTNCGAIAKRQLPDPPPPSIVRSDIDGDIQRKATALWQEFPVQIQHVRCPLAWEDLYTYFDAVDLWTEGPEYLFEVIRYIGYQNYTIDREANLEIQLEIYKWAGEWVRLNEHKLRQVPERADLPSLFNDTEWNEVAGMKQEEFTTLVAALHYHRHLLNLEQENHAAEQVLRDMSAQAARVPQLFQGPPSMPIPQPMTVLHPMSRPGSMIPQPKHSRVNRTNMYQQQPSVFAINQQHYGNYLAAQVPQRSLAGFDSMPVGLTAGPHGPQPGLSGHARNPSNLCSGNANSQSEGRTRWMSNDMDSGQQPRAWNRRDTITQQNRESVHNNFTDRRRNTNNPRGTPPKKISAMVGQVFDGPIYAHNSQQMAQSFESPLPPGSRALNYSGRQNSSGVSGATCDSRMNLPNDARLFESSDYPKIPESFKFSEPPPMNSPQDFEPIELADTLTLQNPPRTLAPPRPFEGHPNVQFTEKASTFSYVNPRPERDVESKRTVYVGGVEEELFTTHRLKQLMSECGTVECISYLMGGRCEAFIQFKEESAPERAINKFHGYQWRTGKSIRVKPTFRNDRRHSRRSSSRSSQRSFNANEHSQSFRRDSDNRCGPHSRKSSISRYQFGRADQPCGPAQPSLNASVGTLAQNSPFHIGSQPQLMQVLPAVMRNEPIYYRHHPPAEQLLPGPLSSAIIEVAQHQAALNRFSQHMPLEVMENDFNQNKNVAERPNGRPRNSYSPVNKAERIKTDDFSKQHPIAMLSNQKENSPIKVSTDPPLRTPKKERLNTGSGGCVSKAQGPKRGKKNPKHSSSINQTLTTTPVKSSFDDMVVEGLKAAGEHDRSSSGPQKASASPKHYPATEKLKRPGSDMEVLGAPTQREQETSLSDNNLVSQDALKSTKKNKIQQVAEKKAKGKITSKNDIRDEKPKNNIIYESDTATESFSSTSPTESSGAEHLTSESRNTSFSHSSSRKSSHGSGESHTSLSSKEAAKAKNTNGKDGLCCNSSHSDKVNATKEILDNSMVDGGAGSHESAPKLLSSSVRMSERQGQHKHSKNGSNTSASSNRSTRKVDSKALKPSANIGDESHHDGNAKVTGGPPTPQRFQEQLPSRGKIEQPTSPTPVLTDLSEWPALGPSKTPPSSIADGKPPHIPVLRPLGERFPLSDTRKLSDASSASVAPSNPRRLTIGSCPSIGSKPWPYVKNCSSN